MLYSQCGDVHEILTGMLPGHEVLPQGRTPVWKGGVEGSYLKMAKFLSGKPRPGGRGGFNFYASLHQERSAKWSKRHSFGSHKSLAFTWIMEHYSDNHYTAMAYWSDEYLPHLARGKRLKAEGQVFFPCALRPWPDGSDI
jgi:hypothetical protein